MERETIVREVTAIARKRLECYGKLASLAEEQRSMLVESRDSDLSDNLAEFDPLLLEIMQLDRREETLQQHLEKARSNGRVIDLGREYAHLTDRTVKTAKLLRDLTLINKELLAGRMEFVNFSLGVIYKVAAEQSLAGDGDNPAIMLDFRA